MKTEKTSADTPADEVLSANGEDAEEVLMEENQRFYANIYPGPSHCLPVNFVQGIRGLEASLNSPLWLLIQTGRGNLGSLSDAVYDRFFQQRYRFSQQENIALLLHSPGGDAKAAYQIARLFAGQCEGFTVIIPKYAKSAATLLALGASEIILGHYAELGPLDVQLVDMDREVVT